MIQEGINGVCMALADSVPGVSGGTIAFIMGFYDHFIASINNVVFGKKEEKTEGLKYLLKLGVGWAAGMIAAVLVLSALFESKIYLVSSLFIGFILGAIPLIISEEKKNIKIGIKNVICLLAGIAVVALITYYNSRSESAGMDLSVFSLTEGIKLFLIGNGVHIGNVFAGNIRIDAAAGIRRLYACCYGGKRDSAFPFFLYPFHAVFRLRRNIWRGIGSENNQNMPG